MSNKSSKLVNASEEKVETAPQPSSRSGINHTTDAERTTKIISTIIAILTIIVVVVSVIIFARFATITRNARNPDSGSDLSEYTTAIANVQTKPEGVSDTYGFVISKNGYSNPVKGVPTVGIYMDFMCPGCGSFEQLNSNNLEKMVDAGQINVEYHFMNFLDSASPDKYSTRAANAAIYIAQKDSGHFLKFVSKMMSEEVQPKENSDSVPSDDDIAQYAEGVGVPKDIAEAAVKAGYSDWISAVNKYTTKRPSLYNLSGDYAGKSMSTPAITVNDKLIDTIKASDEGIGGDDVLLRSLGIDASKVGDESYKIELGDTGDPIPFE